ncbi:hypothetical protein [Shewanella xiamenensis]|uniref:DUF957 domain-containing protein n=1 Tax=Shewanella xiamenensis TaxID=332186 RepID=A0ABT6UGR2_9GAMM|nr:hypothetical protein [Shewanella xiamenensis]MCR4535509.1 hypothetical protein [Shewanella xiamenensis]MDI5833664.1 hypothetical protein [Shewanella xiamenensis]
MTIPSDIFAIEQLILWLKDNISTESAIHFDNEGKVDSVILLTALTRLLPKQHDDFIENMNKYLIWNPAKVSSYGGKADNYEELIQTEEEQECSWSSIVTTDDIGSIVIAIQNECDVDICYKQI